MGVVLRAYDADLDRELAVKLLSPDIAPDSEAGRRFAQEARVAGQLDHPGILPVYEAGRPAGRPVVLRHAVRPAAARSPPSWPNGPTRATALDRWLGVFERVVRGRGLRPRRGGSFTAT